MDCVFACNDVRDSRSLGLLLVRLRGGGFVFWHVGDLAVGLEAAETKDQYMVRNVPQADHGEFCHVDLLVRWTRLGDSTIAIPGTFCGF